MSLFSKSDLEGILEHYDLPSHDDLIYVFSKRDEVSRILMKSNFLGERYKLFKMLYSLDFKKYRDEEISDYDFSWIMTANEEQLYLVGDSELAIEEDSDTILRLVPFAELEYGDYLCFYFSDFNLRPEIALWNKEESEPYNANIVGIAKDLDELLTMAQDEQVLGEAGEGVGG